MKCYETQLGKRVPGVSPDNIETAVENVVDYAGSCREGELERLRDRVEELTKLVGRLVTELHQLRPEQVERVLGWRYEVERD